MRYRHFSYLCTFQFFIHFNTSSVDLFKFGFGKYFHTILYDDFNYLSMLDVKLIQAIKRGSSMQSLRDHSDTHDIALTKGMATRTGKCHTLECHWRNSSFCSLHWNTIWGDYSSSHTHQAHRIKQSSTHASLKWQDGGTPSSNWTGLSKFAFYLEFTTLQCIPVLLFKRLSTSTSLFACLRHEQNYSFCIFLVAVQMKYA